LQAGEELEVSKNESAAQQEMLRQNAAEEVYGLLAEVSAVPSSPESPHPHKHTHLYSRTERSTGEQAY